jgi:hypothetical protein
MYFGITANHQFLYNHQLVFKAKDVPAMGMWKQWTARLVVDHLYHSEIKEIVDSYGITDSQVRIGKWASVLTEKHKSLTDEEKARDKVLASQWRDEGPPLPVKCWCILYVCAAEYPLLISNLSEAEEKAGWYSS